MDSAVLTTDLTDGLLARMISAEWRRTLEILLPAVPIQAVLFDFDGVLVDSEPIRFAAGVRALSEVGIELTWDMFQRFWFGRTDRAGLGEILGARFTTQGAAVMARRNAIFLERIADVPLFSDAERLLARLPTEIRLGIATGSRRAEVQTILGRALPLRRFDGIASAEDYRRPKPDPDPFLAAAQSVGCPPRACLVIEDSPAGVLAAKAGEMPVVGVERSGFPPLPEATWRVQTLDDLLVTRWGEVQIRQTLAGDTQPDGRDVRPSSGTL